MRVELVEPVSLTTEEQTLLSMHSVLNVLNTVMFELRSLGDAVGPHAALEQAEDAVIGVAEDLRDAERATDHVAAADTLTDRLTALIDEAVLASPGAAELEKVRLSRANLDSIFRILEIRAGELTARQTDPDGWVEYEIARLRRNFLEVFAAIERNSHGGYRIVFNLAAHDTGDYFVDFEVTSFRGTVVRMPAALQDVMRDLMANARKYTAPGGRIIAGLDETPDHLRFVVEDSGRGIPREEIPKVIAFGYRGSNVQDRPTYGGGFGLTKAFYLARRFGGRMYIDSELGAGTRVEIEIPQPAGA
jgi:signal transduction histidine kinase